MTSHSHLIPHGKKCSYLFDEKSISSLMSVFSPLGFEVIKTRKFSGGGSKVFTHIAYPGKHLQGRATSKLTPTPIKKENTVPHEGSFWPLQQANMRNTKNPCGKNAKNGSKWRYMMASELCQSWGLLAIGGDAKVEWGVSNEQRQRFSDTTEDGMLFFFFLILTTPGAPLVPC